MSVLTLAEMQSYLQRSISSGNSNKVFGLLAEIDFRNRLGVLGYGANVSVGGWIARSEGSTNFGKNTVAIFPETIVPGTAYPLGGTLQQPTLGLHTICATFHQLGIHSFHLASEIAVTGDPMSVRWQALQLGVPSSAGWLPFPHGVLTGFNTRVRRHNFLGNAAMLPGGIPSSAWAEEFSKEHARVTLQSAYMSEISDIDGIFWGNRYTYPLEIKEKTAGHDRRLGDFFGIDVGPFVKLAFYAARQGNLRSLFVVREIDNQVTRNLMEWWIIPFERLAQYASWQARTGGTSMRGGSSSTVLIPKSEFESLSATVLGSL